MNKIPEDQIADELTQYYSQKKALENNLSLGFTENGKESTLTFYKEKINALRSKLNEINPKRLQEIDSERANDCTIKGEFEIGRQSY
jgi:hypothetical protein